MSNYGPKQYKLYNETQNLRRKENRTSEVIEGIGSNSSVKNYSSKPGQLSAKAQAEREQRKVKKLSGPVKIWTKEEIEALNQKMAA